MEGEDLFLSCDRHGKPTSFVCPGCYRDLLSDYEQVLGEREALRGAGEGFAQFIVRALRGTATAAEFDEAFARWRKVAGERKENEDAKRSLDNRM